MYTFLLAERDEATIDWFRTQYNSSEKEKERSNVRISSSTLE
jgi:hypothetical protein